MNPSVFSYIPISQAPLCTPMGLECYQTVDVNAKECLVECTGLFASVDKKQNFKPMDEIKNMKNIVARYRKYRRGFYQDLDDRYRYYSIPSI